MRTALIVIDVQKGMFAFPEQPHDGDAMLRRIARLVAAARAAAAPVIFVQHDGGTGHPLEKPNENWQLHPGTGYLLGDIVIEKRHCDAFQDTDLQQRLTDMQIGALVLTGMMSEYCVDTTCRRAYSLGYQVTLVSDGHSTLSRDNLSAAQIIAHHNTVLNGSFAAVKPAEEIDFSLKEEIA
jgi:nicotinamidase-related amidase